VVVEQYHMDRIRRVMQSRVAALSVPRWEYFRGEQRKKGAFLALAFISKALEVIVCDVL